MASKTPPSSQPQVQVDISSVADCTPAELLRVLDEILKGIKLALPVFLKRHYADRNRDYAMWCKDDPLRAHRFGSTPEEWAIEGPTRFEEHVQKLRVETQSFIWDIIEWVIGIKKVVGAVEARYDVIAKESRQNREGMKTEGEPAETELERQLLLVRKEIELVQEYAQAFATCALRKTDQAVKLLQAEWYWLKGIESDENQRNRQCAGYGGSEIARQGWALTQQ
ncbi:hypothetical protein H2200_012767 [Cladophialophora chaetospira]|uniref:Uncharacterized protein n=1 Tax=Cladophialophora chaetospira TaxID=386627 RepID=A0AA38WWS5_9EURO|nr:hypothetical protein H2200_012767 [Cladophialophora chaetospira]